MINRISEKLRSYFKLDECKTTVRTEILAGITTFITVAYILILNPQILSHPYEIMGDTQMVTKISNGVFISGMLFILITAIGLREAIIRAIPESGINAVTPGVGLFITIIGLKNSGLVVSNEATLVSLVDFSQWRTPGADISGLCSALVALIGLVVIGVLYIKKVRGAIFLGIIAATLVGIPLGVTSFEGLSFDLGGKFADFFETSFCRLDFAGLLAGPDLVNSIFSVFMLVISFSLVNMFDSIGTLVGAARQSGMVDEDGEIPGMKQALMSDAISTAAGALLGTSTVTTVVESSAGIAVGGRTGLTSLTTSLLFLASLILAPVVGIIPSAATAPALIFVGILMLSNVTDVDLNDMEKAMPAFCTIVFMPFTYSIANGIALGLITHCLILLLTGKVRQIKPLTVIVALIFIARYAFMTLG